MAEFQDIQASAPRVKPAESEKQYDRWQMTQLLVQARTPDGPVIADARFHAFRTTADGATEMAPDDDQYRSRLRVDLREVADQDASAKQVIDALLGAIQRVGQQRGAL
jgi:hypothetical protein